MRNHRANKTRYPDFPAFWKELQEREEKEDESALHEDLSLEKQLLAEHWTEVDPRSALRFFSDKEAPPEMLRTVFQVWADSDPEASREALRHLPNGFFKAAALEGAFSAAEDHPVALAGWFRLAATCGDETLRLMGLTILQNAAFASVEEVKAVFQQSAGNTRYAAAQAVGQSLASTDPIAAVAWARENLSGPGRTNLLEQISRLEGNEEAAAAARALLPKNIHPRPRPPE